MDHPIFLQLFLLEWQIDRLVCRQDVKNAFISAFFFASAMERPSTPGSHMDTQVVVASIGGCLVGVIIVAMIIYLGCFNRRSQRISARKAKAENATSSNLKNESALAAGLGTNGGGTLKRGNF